MEIQTTKKIGRRIQNKRASHTEKLETLKFYRSEIYFEWNLLSNRVTSYITSQSFLVTAFAISMGNGLVKDPQSVEWAKVFVIIFPITLCIVGFLTTLRVYPGIVAAIHTINLWQDKQKSLLSSDEGLNIFKIERETARETANVLALMDLVKIIENDLLRAFSWKKNRVEKQGAEPLVKPSEIDNNGSSDASTKAMELVDYFHMNSLHFALYAPRIFFIMWVWLFIVVVIVLIYTILAFIVT